MTADQHSVGDAGIDALEHHSCAYSLCSAIRPAGIDRAAPDSPSQDLTADVQTLWNVPVCRIPAGYYPPTSHCLREIRWSVQPPVALAFGFGNAIG